MCPYSSNQFSWKKNFCHSILSYSYSFEPSRSCLNAIPKKCYSVFKSHKTLLSILFCNKVKNLLFYLLALNCLLGRERIVFLLGECPTGLLRDRKWGSRGMSWKETIKRALNQSIKEMKRQLKQGQIAGREDMWVRMYYNISRGPTGKGG